MNWRCRCSRILRQQESNVMGCHVPIFNKFVWFRNWEVRRLLPASMQTSTTSGSAFQNMSYSSGYKPHLSFRNNVPTFTTCGLSSFFYDELILSRFWWHGIFNIAFVEFPILAITVIFFTHFTKWNIFSQTDFNFSFLSFK